MRCRSLSRCPACLLLINSRDVRSPAPPMAFARDVVLAQSR